MPLTPPAPATAADDGIAMLVGLRTDVAVHVESSPTPGTEVAVTLTHLDGCIALGSGSAHLITALELLTLGPVVAANLIESIRSQDATGRAAADLERWASWNDRLAPLLVHTLARHGTGLAYAEPMPGRRGYTGLAGPDAMPSGRTLRRAPASVETLVRGEETGFAAEGAAYTVWCADPELAEAVRHVVLDARPDAALDAAGLSDSTTVRHGLAQLLVLAGILTIDERGHAVAESAVLGPPPDDATSAQHARDDVEEPR